MPPPSPSSAAAPLQVWNAFRLFILIETRVNFFVELLFEDDARLKCGQNNLELLGESRGDSPQRAPRGLSSGAAAAAAATAIERRAPHDVTLSSECDQQLKRSLSANRVAQTTWSGAIRRRRKSLSLESLERPGDPSGGEQLATGATMIQRRSPPAGARPVMSRKVVASGGAREIGAQKRDRAQRAQPGEYLLPLGLNMIIIYGFIVKLTFSSSSGTRVEGSNQQLAGRLQQQQLHEAFVARANRSVALLDWHWHEYVVNSLACDLFEGFANGRFSNLVAAGLILPSATVRLIRLQRYVRAHFIRRPRRSASIESRGGCPLAPSGCARDELNIAQTNLCYLNSLQTSWAHWLEMLSSKSWFHKHHFGDLHEERQADEIMLMNSCSHEVHGPGTASGHDHGRHRRQSQTTTLDTYSLRDKIYAVNLINFDSCYGPHFAHSQSRHQLEAARSTNQPMGLQPSGRTVFVAKPAHRIDLNEMAWLILFLAMAYVLSVATLIWKAICALLIELRFESLAELAMGQFLTRLRQLLSSLGLVRWLQLCALDLVTMLTIFDLYNFFACCLICLSRARHLRSRLDQMRHFCLVANRLVLKEQQQQRRLSHEAALLGLRSSGGSSRLASELSLFLGPGRGRNTLKGVEAAAHTYNRGELVLTATTAHDDGSQTFCRFYQRSGCSGPTANGPGQGARPGLHSSSLPLTPDSAAIARALNSELKFVMDLVILVQRELADLKRFFNLYLNLELTIKSVCTTLSICALLDSGTTFEAAYILVTVNGCALPIFITLVAAAYIENEFKGICNNLDHILIASGPMIRVANIKQLISLSDFLSSKANRSFVVVGNFSLSLGSLVPIVAWIVTGVVLLRRD